MARKYVPQVSMAQLSGYRVMQRQESAKIGAYKILGLLPKDYNPEPTYIPSLVQLLEMTKKHLSDLAKKSKRKTIDNKIQR